MQNMQCNMVSQVNVINFYYQFKNIDYLIKQVGNMLKKFYYLLKQADIKLKILDYLFKQVD